MNATETTELKSLEAVEREHIERVLAQHGANRTHAARTLGISKRTLQRKLKAWGIQEFVQGGATFRPSGGSSDL